MKNFGKGLLLFSMLSAGLVSCSDESPWSGSDSEGGINLNFSTDARVIRQTRADDSVSPVVPEASLFAVSLKKSDGSYSKNWTSLDAFNRETSFPIGDYSLVASYGSLEQEGFDSPYYYGSADIHVSPGASTDADVVATLANAMVSVRYTDEFKEQFTAYSAALQSEGHSWLPYAQSETRPVYVSPSEIKLNLTLTNESGETQTIQPASFTAVPRHHYVVTIGVTGNITSGNLALDIQFDDDVVAETVSVSLGEELFTAPAPTITAKGFTDGQEYEAFEFAERAEKNQFHAFAFGGIKSATLTIVSDGYVPLFGRSVQLVNATDLQQTQLANEGVTCAGFFRNADKMGLVDFTGMLEQLPAGEYTIQFEVVDVMTRVSDPVSMKIKINQVYMEMAAAANVDFMGDAVLVDINTNCPDIKNKVTFQVPDANNKMVAAVVKNIAEVNAPSAVKTRASYPYTYRYTLALDPQIRTQIDVTAKVGTLSDAVSVPMSAPDYTLEADAYARRVLVKITSGNSSQTQAIMNNIKFYNRDTEIPTSNISLTSDGLIAISGFNPGTQYINLKAAVGAFETAIPSLTTETEDNIANGDFSNLDAAVTYSDVNLGGKYRVSPVDYQWTANISYQEPQGWATVNEFTCYGGSNPQNTWFMVPSTFADNGAVVVRSVGYHHAGTVPDRSGGAFNTKYYCQNAPAELMKASGELFLGSYSYTGSENRTEGIAFYTRPASLSFDYSYAPLNGELAEVYVRVYDSSNKVLVERTQYLNAASSMTNVKIPMDGYTFGKKAARIQLGFRSTRSGVTPTVNIPTGSSLSEGQTVLGSRNLGTNNYKALATGSVLRIDNVQLGYDFSSSAASAKRRKR